MNTYLVYFELFGKRMKVRIKATSKQDAQDQVARRIKFHKVELEETDRTVEDLMNLFKMKKP